MSGDIVGGLRARLIRDSVYHWIYDGLDQLDWFEAGRRHRPIVFTGTQIEMDAEIGLNTVALSDEGLLEAEMELGSTGVETQWTYYLDFYAESDAIGKHLVNDVRDLLGGRMGSIGYSDPSVPVFDYRLATPVQVFTVHIEDLVVDRAHDFPKPWQKHWYSCRFDVVDAYHDEA